MKQTCLLNVLEVSGWRLEGVERDLMLEKITSDLIIPYHSYAEQVDIVLCKGNFCLWRLLI